MSGLPMNEQDAIDAARYRWLRDEANKRHVGPMIVIQSNSAAGYGMSYISPSDPSKIDAAVDEVMLDERKTGGQLGKYQ
ncbi:hypothetical protein [Paraburkholderia sp. SIMBA_054]|uniref:hypothetical protein n=1 Tax=Paraburkholderia sp. SIMBA_054 TaxID=3085795 RepID=UPI00397E6F8C